MDMSHLLDDVDVDPEEPGRKSVLSICIQLHIVSCCVCVWTQFSCRCRSLISVLMCVRVCQASSSGVSHLRGDVGADPAEPARKSVPSIGI